MSYSTIEVPGNLALRILHERRAAFPTTGEYPFLIGDRENLERLEEGASFVNRSAEDIIKASFDLDTNAWLAERRREEEELRREDEGSDFTEDEVLGTWPTCPVDPLGLTLHTNLQTGQPLPSIFMGLARIEGPWQLPAVVKFGEYNACPEPEVHCAFHRDWQTRFGAEIAGISADVIECIVPSPPIEKQQSLELAWEQFWYCDDIVLQGVGTVSNLAATVCNGRNWYFWWD